MDACEVRNYLQTAAGEIGFDEHRSIKDGYAEPEAKARFKKYVEDGRDPRWYGDCRADDIYDDKSFIQDIMGDYIYSEPNREEILNDLESEFPEVVKKLRRD